MSPWEFSVRTLAGVAAQFGAVIVGVWCMLGGGVTLVAGPRRWRRSGKRALWCGGALVVANVMFWMVGVLR